MSITTLVNAGQVIKVQQPELSTATAGKPPAPAMIPVSITTDWVPINVDPSTADNSGSAVQYASAVTRQAFLVLLNEGWGTTMQLRMRYPKAATVGTAPVVQPFGFASDSEPQLLTDILSGANQLTLSSAATDAQGSNYAYTTQFEVDMHANLYTAVAIKTAASVTGGPSGSITGATKASPIVITSTAHGLSTGWFVTVASVGGNTAANGVWYVKVLTANTFALMYPGSIQPAVGNATYTSGGTWTLNPIIEVRVK